ncbi:MAG: hypothetical protein ACMZ66_01670 [Thalassospira sp.]|uniref:hypothetical protein n=1 Tax=Thalassospira sp. TaxID=1912094 RepID=UPI003A8B5217
MANDTLYISPEYNPHSLERDWGFFVREQRGRVFERMSSGLEDLRAALCNVGRSGNQVHAPKPAKVTTDALAENAEQLCSEVGLDVVSLALLADVPMHRPLHVTHNSLIGHWRWLRAVWRFAAELPQYGLQHSDPRPDPAISAFLTDGKNNLAIAALREKFKQLEQEGFDPENYLSFASGLTLFCPFIGTELLWRQGLITASKAKGTVK